MMKVNFHILLLLGFCIALILFVAHWSSEGIRIFLKHNFWTAMAGAVCPWLFLLIVMLGIAPSMSGAGREGLSMVAMAPLFGGAFSAAICFLGCVFRGVPNGAREALVFGLKWNIPIVVVVALFIAWLIYGSKKAHG